MFDSEGLLVRASAFNSLADQMNEIFKVFFLNVYNL